jgi:hypothetical protein
MNFAITKLDRRHSYWEYYEYMVEFKKAENWLHKTHSGVLEFDRARRWFNETYGWSQDIETRQEMLKVMDAKNKSVDDNINSHWAYSIRYQEYRIYVDESALTMFKLKWSGNG